MTALEQECERLGVTWATPLASLADARDADTVVIANGIDAPTLWPGLPIRPVKGEVLRLRWRRGCMAVPQRVIRARVHGRPVYLVPRADGGLLVIVDLHDLDVRAFPGDLLEDRRDHAARAAPDRPEVDDHGDVGLEDLGLERGVGDDGGAHTISST